jgi:hypothetical protein
VQGYRSVSGPMLLLLLFHGSEQKDLAGMSLGKLNVSPRSMQCEKLVANWLPDIAGPGSQDKHGQSRSHRCYM